MRKRSKAVVAKGVPLTGELELTAPVDLERASIEHSLSGAMVLFFFCRSFFRPAGRKNDLQRIRNPWIDTFRPTLPACRPRLAHQSFDLAQVRVDRKSTRLNSSHGSISYA